MENEVQSNVLPVQPLPQTPLVTPPSTNLPKLLLVALLALVVATGLLFVGIQIGKNQTQNQQPIVAQPMAAPTETAISPTVQPTASPTISLIGTESNNWRTYTGKTFSFRYPNSWADVTENVLSTRTEAVSEGNLIVSDGIYYSQVLGRAQTYQEYINQTVPSSIKTTSFNLESLKGVRYIEKDSGGRVTVKIILSDNSVSTRIFSINYFSPVSDLKTTDSLLDPILSTFIFTK
jgi:hypothetical protein